MVSNMYLMYAKGLESVFFCRLYYGSRLLNLVSLISESRRRAGFSVDYKGFLCCFRPIVENFKSAVKVDGLKLPPLLQCLVQCFAKCRFRHDTNCGLLCKERIGYIFALFCALFVTFFGDKDFIFFVLAQTFCGSNQALFERFRFSFLPVERLSWLCRFFFSHEPGSPRE